MGGGTGGDTVRLSDDYGTHFRVFFYRGPAAVVEQHDRPDHFDLPGMLRSADSVAGDDALWSLAVVLAGADSADSDPLLWLVGMDYLRTPSTSLERFRRRSMEQQFLLKRALAGQALPTLPDGRRVIRMFPDYGAVFPLWEDGTEHYPALPEHFGVGDELDEDLRRWQQQWEQVQVSQRDWSPADEDRWMLDGDELADRLEREVGPGFMVRREYRLYWPPDGSVP